MRGPQLSKYPSSYIVLLRNFDNCLTAAFEGVSTDVEQGEVSEVSGLGFRFEVDGSVRT
jgi:hypothetical protein